MAQCHRTSPSRSLQEGFAQLLDKWMRHPEHRIRLKRINRMGHLCNFLLDILCILEVHGMTFCMARLHSLSTFFVDYLRIDPQLDMDRTLQNRTGISAAIAWPGSTWPLSSLSPHCCRMSNFALGKACMQTCMELLRKWEACLMMEDIALTIRSSNWKAAEAEPETVSALLEKEIANASLLAKHHDCESIMPCWHASTHARCP